MNVYIIASTEASDLTEMIAGAFPEGDRFRISGQVWLVASKSLGSALDVYNKFYTAAAGQTPDEPITGTMIVPVKAYYGFGNVSIWQWIGRMQSS